MATYFRVLYVGDREKVVQVQLPDTTLVNTCRTFVCVGWLFTSNG